MTALEPGPERSVDPVDSARAAGLRYVTAGAGGLTRHRSGRGFVYRSAEGAAIRDETELARIRSLAIPPAWTEVWICPGANGHLQATGRDARGRKQYRYHRRWRETRDETKYGRMVAFGEALPAIRARVDRDLGLPGLPREKVLATVVKLMEITRIRVGNEEYARANDSFGLTTLRNRHVEVAGSRLHFRFRGKSGKDHAIGVSNRRLARIVERCRDIPGYELFQYLDETGEPRSIDSSDVNGYLREITGQDFTAKDFRTWAGTVLVAVALRRDTDGATATPTKRALKETITRVAGELGNTPAICRKCYVHPAIIDAYLDGGLAERLGALATRDEKPLDGLSEPEAVLLRFLRAIQAEAAVPLERKLAQSLDAVGARRARGVRARRGRRAASRRRDARRAGSARQAARSSATR